MSSRLDIRGLGVVTSLAVGTFAFLACGGQSSGVPATGHDERGATASDAAPDGDASRPGVAFMQGSIVCCESGLGQTCCSAEEKERGACAEALPCSPAGSGAGGKIYCSECCDGPGVISRAQLVDGKCVDHSFPDDGPLCAACGDGVCNASAHESSCNCPADCGPPP